MFSLRARLNLVVGAPVDIMQLSVEHLDIMLQQRLDSSVNSACLEIIGCQLSILVCCTWASPISMPDLPSRG